MGIRFLGIVGDYMGGLRKTFQTLEKPQNFKLWAYKGLFTVHI